jgi:hypothetical protein
MRSLRGRIEPLERQIASSDYDGPRVIRIEGGLGETMLATLIDGPTIEREAAETAEQFEDRILVLAAAIDVETVVFSGLPAWRRGDGGIQ